MIQLITLSIVKMGHNSRAHSPIPRCGSLAVAFLSQGARASADFWANMPHEPNLRHALALEPPQVPAGQNARDEALAGIGPSRVVRF
jgi:hypothetical protein